MINSKLSQGNTLNPHGFILKKGNHNGKPYVSTI